ncbi:uncharacterized protein BP01DRAFT_117511 [Aspergillus saccharolyticus JOP 1030-1]|uniref:Uncharacterized protein n=1 Tax=Aspergillus saccharolyticus JOP 1030-1 TaxID=1450539 RepID=A0A318ZXS8_9EURO|nr:hypothetical protein BP01DRAFT_117511 [Aspergillus saccharolyticus JOP 1030-1]PYH48970.1 hypothetical protein BP01DRAFT_117511 [Aspergillus saccharolyticus JOP 1030-1]
MPFKDCQNRQISWYPLYVSRHSFVVAQPLISSGCKIESIIEYPPKCRIGQVGSVGVPHSPVPTNIE